MGKTAQQGGDRVACHQLPASQKGLNHVPFPARSSCDRSFQWQYVLFHQGMFIGTWRSKRAALVVSPLQTGFPLQGGLFRVCCFQLSHSLLLWAFFYRLWREMEPFACQLLMTKWLSFFPYFSIEEFPKQPPLFSTPSPLTSLLIETVGWRQNCQWWESEMCLRDSTAHHSMVFSISSVRVCR